MVGLTYSNTRYTNIGALGGATASFNDIEAGLRWQFTPAFFAGVAYNYTKGANLSAGGQNVGDQQLHAFQRAAGTSSTGTAAVANIGGIGDSSNNHQALVRVALRHRF